MVYEASFSGILKILFWIFIISMLIRLVARLALPHVIKKAEEKMREHAGQYSSPRQQPRNEGEVTIEKQSTPGRRSKDDDYVDYVEIKD